MDDDILIVFTHCPDSESAERLAHNLVESKLAACVNILAPCRSIYWWQGEVEQACEIPVQIKTTRLRYGAVESSIRSQHPYTLPEIMAVSVAAGLAGYLDWIRQSVTAPQASGMPGTP